MYAYKKPIREHYETPRDMNPPSENSFLGTSSRYLTMSIFITQYL